jgi:hypothetical protein
MAGRSDVKLKKPSDVALSTAGALLEQTFDAFEASKLSFALLIFEAGNRDKESFRLAIREALRGSWRTWTGRVKLSDAGADSLFKWIDFCFERQLSVEKTNEPLTVTKLA